jgi:hypothetical protein
MEYLPRLIQALYADDYYTSGVHDSFWITTRGSYKTACMHLGLGKHAKTLESNPVTEDTWKSSGSTDIGPDNFYMKVKLRRELEEHFARKQAINIWHGPRHPAFNSLIERVKSFEDVDWSETNPIPVSLAESGFFYDSKLIISFT